MLKTPRSVAIDVKVAKADTREKTIFFYQMSFLGPFLGIFQATDFCKVKFTFNFSTHKSTIKVNGKKYKKGTSSKTNTYTELTMHLLP